MPPANNPHTDQVEANPNKRKNTPAQRRGPKGYFQGSRKKFLEDYLPTYVSYTKGNRHKFWHDLFNVWWQRYPWKLNDKQEPPTDDSEKMTRLASVGPGDRAIKAAVEEKLTERLSQWFVNHALGANNGTRRDTLSWFPLLQQLHKIRNPRPRPRTTAQQFMVDYPLVLNAAFVTRHGDGKNFSNIQRVNLRHDLAKSLLSSEYSHCVRDLEKKAKAEHDVKIDEWNLTLDDIPLAGDVDQARDTLFDAVHPLLQAIGSYAGCYVTLIAGNATKDDTDEGFFTAVHWWPGDHSLTKNWTQWDEDGFNSGTAGPFLAYAGENNKILEATSKEQPATPVQMPQVSPLLAPPTGNDAPPTRIQSAVSTTSHRAKYRPIPTKGQNHTLKESRLIQYSEHSESDGGVTSENSGDGSSSGESLPDAPPRRKRQRTSRITRSSTWIPASDTDTGGASNPTSLAIPDTDVGAPSPVLSVSALTTPIGSPGLRSDTSEDMDVSPDGDAPLAETTATRNTGTGTAVTTDIENMIAANTETAFAVSTGDDDSADAGITSTSIANPTKAPSTADSTLLSPLSQVSLNTIDEATIPVFLLSHGKGKREVNIFHYLKDVEDPHFQRVLFNYLHFEINDKSRTSGSLPTTNRPVEISQWSSRARPATLPDYTKGKRTFVDFINSVLAWWALIQPPWRTFERGKVSRNILGGWDVLYAPRINGLLNVVMLVYWWIKFLGEHKPGDRSARADYELFAEDVAWVFSKLSS